MPGMHQFQGWNAIALSNCHSVVRLLDFDFPCSGCARTITLFLLGHLFFVEARDLCLRTIWHLDKALWFVKSLSEPDTDLAFAQPQQESRNSNPAVQIPNVPKP